MENRAAVFSNEPQDVEVFQHGAWWPGSLLGWRHDATGSCQVWVRLETAGGESTIWTELTALRLPGSTPEPARGEVSRSLPRAEVADMAATRELKRIDAAAGVQGLAGPLARPVGETGVATASAEQVPAWRLAAARAGGGGTPGRHRAPGIGGRHRAADTETFPAVGTGDTGVRSRPAWPVAVEDGWPVVVEESLPARPERSWAPRNEPDADVYTRPLRLNAMASGGSSQPRGNWNGRLAGS